MALPDHERLVRLEGRDDRLDEVPEARILRSGRVASGAMGAHHAGDPRHERIVRPLRVTISLASFSTP